MPAFKDWNIQNCVVHLACENFGVTINAARTHYRFQLAPGKIHTASRKPKEYYNADECVVNGKCLESTLSSNAGMKKQCILWIPQSNALDGVVCRIRKGTKLKVYKNTVLLFT